MPGRTAHVRERVRVGARAKSSPRLPRVPGGLRGRGEQPSGGAAPAGQEGLRGAGRL